MTDTKQRQAELAEIEQTLKSLEKATSAFAQKTRVDARARKAEIEAELHGSGAIAQDGSTAIGERGFGANGDVLDSVIVTGDHNRLKIYQVGPQPKHLPLPEALQRYLDNLIAAHQHLRLQGIRAGSQPLSVALEKVYVSLSAVDKRAGGAHTEKAAAGNLQELHGDSGYLTIGAALQRYHRLVITGDPGSGKTTLLAYLVLTYARTLRDGVSLVSERLGLAESEHLPILLPLRDLGCHLLEKEHSNPGKDGPALLVDYLLEYYQAQVINLPKDFFDPYLEKGQVVLLLDGMDEVADPVCRQRVARLIEKFAMRYEKCRFVVTSREVGYEGAARIGADFGLAKIREFSNAEVRQFVHDWARAVESALSGNETNEVLRIADEQSGKLIGAIENNPRVAELAVNPLLLTVIALVHRYRAQLPERRSELYEEAVEVLLGHWDAAKGMETEFLLAGRALDGGDRRSLLEPVAFWLQEHRKRDLERDDLCAILLPKFMNLAGGDKDQARKALDIFLRLINERSGLLIERGVGVYGFAHLTFQEYLAARVLAEREDALAYSLNVLPNPWWREVLLLEAGYLGNQGTRRVSALIRAILDADPKTEPEPHHHLLLAAECLFDVGPARVEGDLLGEARRRLKKQADTPFKKGDKAAVLAKITASSALARLESGQVVAHFWKPPWGEPEWVTIPAGEFWMGDDKSQYDNEKPAHTVTLPEYQIARVPVTNAQYALYVQDAKAEPPEHWRGGKVPPGLESHPVVNVSWNDAIAYCAWLGEKIHKPVTLPSEAEWEKAARGSHLLIGEGRGDEVRAYPWGNDWRELHCNSTELGLGHTTPVGLFLNGASPYGLLDMSGNVWEWTRSIWDEKKYKYPYKSDDGRERIRETAPYVLRGGAFFNPQIRARCAFRGSNFPDSGIFVVGFRIVVSPLFLS